MEEKQLLSGEDLEKPNYRDMLSSNGMGVVLILFTISALVSNFAISLLAIYYIIILDLSDQAAGFFLALLTVQALFCFLPAYLRRHFGFKGIYLLSTLFGILSLTLLILIENLAFQIFLLTFLFSSFPAILSTCLLSEIGSRASLANKSLAFSLMNSLFNLTTVFLGLLFELVVFLNGLNHSSFKIIFGVLLVSLVVGLFIILLLYENFEPAEPKRKTSFWKTLNFKQFWKAFAVMIICSLPIATALSPGYVLPIYMDRELGSTSGFGILYSMYFLMAALASLALNFTVNVFSLYDNLPVGSGIIALGPLAFLIGNDIFTVSLYLTIVAAGIGILGSRYVDYLGFAAIKGLEIYFYGLVQVSFAFSTLVIGLVTGFTLDAFCPEDGKRSSWIMWMIVSGYTFLAFLMLILFSPWLRYYFDSQEADPYMFSVDETQEENVKN